MEQWTHLYVDGNKAGDAPGWHFPPLGTGVSLHGEHEGVQFKVIRVWWSLDNRGDESDYTVRIDLERA
jgi:hypothetical protein